MGQTEIKLTQKDLITLRIILIRKQQNKQDTIRNNNLRDENSLPTHDLERIHNKETKLISRCIIEVKAKIAEVNTTEINKLIYERHELDTRINNLKSYATRSKNPKIKKVAFITELDRIKEIEDINYRISEIQFILDEYKEKTEAVLTFDSDIMTYLNTTIKQNNIKILTTEEELVA